jgi:tetratricopeptide (TPR) repeat protein
MIAGLMIGPRDDRSSGRVGLGVFPGLLRDLHVHHRSGLLRFAQGGDSGSVCFIHGDIAWGESSLHECHLGPVLVRHGLLAQETLDRIAPLVGPGVRLGDLLVRHGSLDRATLDQGLGLQVRETLLAVFAWRGGTWQFEEHPAEYFKGYERPLPVSTGDIILDAAWSLPDCALVRDSLGSLDRPLALTTDPLLRFQRLNLTATDGFLLSVVDGALTARQVLALAPLDEEEALRGLFGLLCTGMIEFVDPLAPAARGPEPAGPSREEVVRLYRELPGKDHFELLGLERTASEADAAAAFARCARRFHPDARQDPALADLRPQLEAIVARLCDARRVLGDPQRRAEYESALILSRLVPAADSDAAPAAPPPVDTAAAWALHEQMLSRAEQEFGEGRYWDALQVAEALLEELKGAQRRRALQLRARVYSKNPKWHRQAEEQLRALVAEDPANAEHLFLLGQLYAAEGMHLRATTTLKRALALKPRHAGVMAALAECTRGRGGGGSGKRRA